MADVLSALDNKTANTSSPPKLRSRKVKATAMPAAQQAAATACSTTVHAGAPNPERVKLLAVAFNESKAPSTRAVHKLARRCRMQPKEVEDWFERRNTLDLWCVCILAHFGLTHAAHTSCLGGRVGLMPLHTCATARRVNKHNLATAGAVAQALTQCKVMIDAEKEMAQIGLGEEEAPSAEEELLPIAVTAVQGSPGSQP